MFISSYAKVLLQVGELAEGIFEVGFWTAVILVVVVGLIIFWLVRKFRGRR